MVKDKKTIIANGIYHITQRAPGKELLFLESKDNLYFLKLLKETSKKFSIDIFCFALLSNHLHILLKIKDENLSAAMKFLFQSYALYFNTKYQRKGHVFCGRYKHFLCDNDKYLLTVSIYIHLNPFKAGLTKDIFEYKWYSLTPYISNITTSFLKTDSILGLLDRNLSKAKKLYKKLLIQSDNLKYLTLLNTSNAVSIFYREFYNLITKHKLFSYSKKEEYWKKLEKTINEFSQKKRSANTVEQKALAYLIQQLLSSGYSIKEITERLNIHRTTIYRLRNKYKNN